MQGAADDLDARAGMRDHVLRGAVRGREPVRGARITEQPDKAEAATEEHDERSERAAAGRHSQAQSEADDQQCDNQQQQPRRHRKRSCG